MCGRFTLTAAGEVVASVFELAEVPVLSPRYNIAPTQPVVAVVSDSHEPKRLFKTMRWGLIPCWAKDPSIAARMINARAETVATKRAYQSAFRHRRCLIAADGFYEWRQAAPKKPKQPYYVRMEDSRPFAFAGLWEHWEGSDGSAIDSCTVITTEPNELMKSLHDRMPAILRPEYFDRWLDPGIQDAESLQPLLRPYLADKMTAHPVSIYVNDPSHDTARCIEPLRS